MIIRCVHDSIWTVAPRASSACNQKSMSETGRVFSSQKYHAMSVSQAAVFSRSLFYFAEIKRWIGLKEMQMHWHSFKAPPFVPFRQRHKTQKGMVIIMANKKAAVIMGSDSDLPIVKARKSLEKLRHHNRGSCIQRTSYSGTSVWICSEREKKRLWCNHCSGRKSSAFSRCISRAYHFAGHRYSGKIFYVRRIGRASCNGADAKRHSGCNGRYWRCR